MLTNTIKDLQLISSMISGKPVWLLSVRDRRYIDGLVKKGEGINTGSEIFIGPNKYLDLIWAIGLHEIGHDATAKAADSLLNLVAAKDKDRYPEYWQIKHRIPVERMAWVWAIDAAAIHNRHFSLRAYLYMYKRLWDYRICYGGEYYRYEKMNWFARRRVDLRAILAILGF